MIAVAIAEEQTIGNLNHYQEITSKLADPRKLTDAEPQKRSRRANPSTT